MSTPIQIPKKDGTVTTVYASNAVEAERFVQVMHELAAMLPALKALENNIRKHLAESEQIGELPRPKGPWLPASAC